MFYNPTITDEWDGYEPFSYEHWAEKPLANKLTEELGVALSPESREELTENFPTHQEAATLSEISLQSQVTNRNTGPLKLVWAKETPINGKKLYVKVHDLL